MKCGLCGKECDDFFCSKECETEYKMLNFLAGDDN